jgi:hypothetical protein
VFPVPLLLSKLNTSYPSYYLWGLGGSSYENGNIPLLSLYIYCIYQNIKDCVFSMPVLLSVKYDEELKIWDSVSVDMSRTGTRSTVISESFCLFPFCSPLLVTGLQLKSGYPFCCFFVVCTSLCLALAI